MKPPLLKALVAALVGVCAACSKPATETNARYAVSSVNPALYSLPASGALRVHVHFVNATDAVAYIGHCGERPAHVVERLEGTTWKSLALPECPMYWQAPTTVTPKDTFAFDVELMPGPTIAPADLVGTFRVGVGAYRTADAAITRQDNLLLPDSVRLTNSFEIVK